jgi:hypothetical protein
MGALMLMPERVPVQGRRPGRRPSRGELLSRLIDSGTAWLYAELGLMRIDAGMLVRRIVTGLAMAIFALALLTTSLVVLSGTFIEALALYLDDRMLAGFIVAAGLFSSAAVIIFTLVSFLTSRWPAVSLAFKTIMDRASFKDANDEG